MAKHTFKILRCEHRKIFKVCLAIFQHYEIKGSKENVFRLEVKEYSISSKRTFMSLSQFKTVIKLTSS